MFTFDTDHSLIDTGVWAEYQGGRFLIAHISNIRFQRELAKLQQPHRKKIEAGTLDPQTNRDLLCKAMAEGVLLDWQDVKSVGSDDPVPYSKEAGFKAISRDPEFRDFITEFAVNLQNYRNEEIEELGKS
jgi:hypothetical protein